MTVRRFLAEVDSAELTEWIALYALRAEEHQRAHRAAERGAKRPSSGGGPLTDSADIRRAIDQAQAAEQAGDGS